MMMMESIGLGGGGCCVARYDDAQKIDRIMLRFRPIAPKPTAGGSSSGGSSPENNRNGDTYVKIGRGKRRYNNNSNNNENNNAQKISSKRRKASPEVVTLPLLPEAPEKSSKRSTPNAPIWLNFNCGAVEKDDGIIEESNHRPICYVPDRTVITPPRVVCSTCVTLECLTRTMVDADALGRTDEERVMNLQWDTCPGFVSDRMSRVTWSNAAFKKMVGDDPADSCGGAAASRAWVTMKESVPAVAGAFSCRVRVQVEDQQRKTMTVPCDVWRMDCGGFAWRLDVKAALSLGL